MILSPILSPNFYALASFFAFTIGLVSVIVFLNYVIPRKKLWVGEERISVADNRADPDLRHLLKSRRKTTAISLAITLACASFFIWTFTGGEAAAQRENGVQDQMARVQASATSHFVDPLTDSQLRDLAELKTTEIGIILPDGTALNIPFNYEPRLFLLTGASNFKAQTDTPIVNKGSTWSITADQQRVWTITAAIKKFQENTVTELTANYGILLDDKQLSELEIPDEAPETITRYGMTKLATSNGDDYLLVNATLIWDQEFKLISTPEGGTIQTELPRVSK